MIVPTLPAKQMRNEALSQSMLTFINILQVQDDPLKD